MVCIGVHRRLAPGVVPRGTLTLAVSGAALHKRVAQLLGASIILSKRAGDHTRAASSGQGLEIAASVPCRTKRTELGQSDPFSDLNVRPRAKLAILLSVLLEGSPLIAGSKTGDFEAAWPGIAQGDCSSYLQQN